MYAQDLVSVQPYFFLMKMMERAFSATVEPGFVSIRSYGKLASAL